MALSYACGAPSGVLQLTTTTSNARSCVNEGILRRITSMLRVSISAVYDARFRCALGQDLPPGRNDKAVPEGLAANFVPPALRGCKYECLRLDRTRLEQRVPVRLAGDAGERGGACNEPGTALGERAVQGGKAQIIADRQAQRSPRQIRQDGARPGLVIDAFAVDSRHCRDRHRTYGSCRIALQCFRSAR